MNANDEVKGGATVEFDSADSLRKAMRDDPTLADQVMKDLEALEQEELQAKREAADKPPKMIEKEPVAPPAEPQKTPDQSSESDDEIVTVKIPKSLMGTYLKNRTADEAAVEMAKGYREKDKTIDFLKSSRKELESKLNDTLTDLQKEAEKAQEAAKQLETIKAQANAMPAGGAPREVVKAPDGTKVVLPEIPALPEEPEELMGDDLLNDQKVDKFNADKKAYRASMRSYHAAISDRLKKIDEIETKSEDTAALLAKFERAEKELADLRAGVQKVETHVNTQAARESADNQSIKEYMSIEGFRSQHPEIFNSTREIAEIEAENIEFLKEVAQAIGVAGGIYMAGGSGRIKPDVWGAFQTYLKEPESEAGKKLREDLSLRGASAPADYDELDKVYRIREIMSRYPKRGSDGKLGSMSYEEALHMASLEHEDLRRPAAGSRNADPSQGGGGSPQASAAAQQRMAEVEARERAAKKREGYAKEPEPSSSSQGMDVDNIDTSQLSAVFRKKPRDRSDAETELIKAVGGRFGMSQTELERMLTA